MCLCLCSCAPVTGLHDKRRPRTARLEVTIPARVPWVLSGSKARATSRESGAGKYCQDVSRKLFPCPSPFYVEACSTWPPSSPLTSPHGERGTPLMVSVGGLPVCLQGMCVLICSQPHLPILSCRELAVSSTLCARWVSLISG